MSKIRLHGSSSGYTEIAPVAASGNNTLTLPDDGTIISKDSNGAVGVTSITVGTGVTIGDGRVTCSTLHGSAASLTSIPAANIVGVCTAGLTRTGGFGGVKQIAYSQTKSNTTLTSSSYTNISSLQVTITPTSSSNLLYFQYALQARIYRNGSNDGKAWIAISDDAGSSYLAENYHRTYDYGGSGSLIDIGVSGYAIKTAGSTSARTYYIYVKIATDGAVFELNPANNQNNSVCTVMEIEP